MPKEIERKFLVQADLIDGVLKGRVGVLIRQGYLPSGPRLAVRVRIKGEGAYLTLKGSQKGISRDEYEYRIQMTDAEELLIKYAQYRLTKTRYEVAFEGHRWEVDVFHDRLEGIILAELELNAEDEVFALPPWVGRDVSDLPQFSNAALASHVSFNGARPTVEDFLTVEHLPTEPSLEETERRIQEGLPAGVRAFGNWMKGG